MTSPAHQPPPDKPAEAAPLSISEAATAEQIAEQRIHRTEQIISYILRGGVLISLSLVLLGLILTFAHHADYFTSQQAYQNLSSPGAVFPHSIQTVWQSVRQFHGEGIITLGLLVLIATPVVRVAISIVTFIYMRDRLYTLITAVVLALLILSFFLGKTE